MADMLPPALMDFGLLFSFITSVIAVGLFTWEWFAPAISIPQLQVAQSQVTGLTAALAADVKLAGSTMTGPLVLAADPTVALGAATKQYVDSGVGGALIASKTVEKWSAVLDAVAAGTYTGASSITTLGTISSGVWNGGIIPVAYGGSGSAAPSLVGGSNISISGSWPAQTVSLSGVVSPALGGTGVNNGALAITLAGNLTTVGAFDITLTSTAKTNVVLPASGTLVNTAVTTLASLANVGVLQSLIVDGASLSPNALATTSLGTTSVPFTSLWLGASATSQVKLVPAATAASRIISIPDPLAAANMLMSTPTIAVTQATSNATAVTANGASCQVTSFGNFTNVIGTAVKFTLNNSAIKATSFVVPSILNYTGTMNTNGIPVVTINNVAAGSCDVWVSNVHASAALAGALTMGFLVI